MKLINKDALVAKIRKELLPVAAPIGVRYDDWERGEDNERLHILALIDALEVKDVDLEKEVELWMGYYADYDGYFNPVEFAKHFFELGLNKRA